MIKAEDLKTKVLITGQHGYLGKHIINDSRFEEYDFIYFKGNINTKKNYEDYKENQFDQIWHLASPAADLEEYPDDYIKESIIEGTNNIIDLAKKTNSKLIYFSSEASLYASDLYGKCKQKANKNVVQKLQTNYKILIIPRVYSKDRQKGLIAKQTIDVAQDLNKLISYIFLDEFLDEFKRMLDSKLKIETFETQTTTIKEMFLNLKK